MQKVWYCLLLILLPSIGVALDPPKQKPKFLPKRKFITTFTADSRAHRLSIAKNFDQNSWTASMGGIMPVLNFNLGNLPLQWSAAGSTWLTLQRANGAGAVINNDFFADTWVDAALTQNWYMRLGTGHSSQHLSDDALLLGLPFGNYAKDYHFMGMVYKNKKYHLQSYALSYYNYNFKTSADISGKFLFQLGFEHAPFIFRNAHQFYYAADIKLREEHRFEPTFNIQIGYKVTDEEDSALRIALDQSIGKEERGSFMYQNRNFARLAIYIDF